MHSIHLFEKIANNVGIYLSKADELKSFFPLEE